MRVIGYIRVSTDHQHHGPDAQRAALERWCSSQGAELVAVESDVGVSGAAPLDKRPGLLRAVDAVEREGATVLLVSRRDRLARDVILAAMAERLVERAGARVASADGAGEGDSPEALLMRRICDAFGEYERQVIRARTRAALAVKRARGERTGHVPYGYQLGADGVQLVEHAGEQEVIRLVREYQREGLSLRQIGERFNALGILPRSGGQWHAQTVRRIAQGVGARACEVA